ncbi:AAA family ATPase [Lacticaseibacillus mingshuiensis]|uniref:AAA family ATPase n=1 Tax=Lacticaseibacillus mingshuiensis TaxID=2799574 RepID=UPI0019506B24
MTNKHPAPILVLLRGNSGSGKTYLANQLQEALGTNACLLISQDVMRREIMHANDHAATQRPPCSKRWSARLRVIILLSSSKVSSGAMFTAICWYI